MYQYQNIDTLYAANMSAEAQAAYNQGPSRSSRFALIAAVAVVVLMATVFFGSYSTAEATSSLNVIPTTAVRPTMVSRVTNMLPSFGGASNNAAGCQCGEDCKCGAGCNCKGCACKKEQNNCDNC